MTEQKFTRSDRVGLKTFQRAFAILLGVIVVLQSIALGLTRGGFVQSRHPQDITLIARRDRGI
jgi:hypothetical protein